MTPVAKYMARSGAIHRNHIKAASRNTTMNTPINAWSSVRRSRNHAIYRASAGAITEGKPATELAPIHRKSDASSP